ncbi:MAG: zf-TFIIB domain-containing protein [Pyrinomonadaceae bacterium]|nr:zf-TFIIB domain-containing protein [Pyrinomonadaceae bacterium]
MRFAPQDDRVYVLLSLMFVSDKYCSHCGNAVVDIEAGANIPVGKCPRCRSALTPLAIENTLLSECQRCGGFWSSADTFEDICAEKERRASVLRSIQERSFPKSDVPVKYVPCPVCGQLMNRNNFARSSGVILDICKEHGVWFDAEELPAIITFVRQGGLDRARENEKIALNEQKRDLIEMQNRIARQDARFAQGNYDAGEPLTDMVRGFVKLLFR